MLRFAAFVLAALLVATSGQAATIHVPGDQPTIQAGVDAAAGGDTVMVAPGTYLDCTHPDFDGALNCVIISKSIALRSSGGSTATTIDAQGLGRVLLCQGDHPSLIEGFTIRGGNAPAGAGIRLYFGYPLQNLVLRDMSVVDNLATGYGGGGLLVDPFSYTTSLIDCEFALNSAPRGGAVLAIVLDQILDCVIVDNATSNPNSAALDILDNYTLLEVRGTLIARNEGVGAKFKTKAICPGTVRVTECTIADNSSGDAVLVNYQWLQMERTVCVGDVECVGSYETVSLDFVNVFDGTVDLSCYPVWQQPNLDADPLFCGPERGDYSLQSNSPCLPQNNEYGVLYGAFGRGCDPVSIEPATWARIKAKYSERAR